MSTIRQRIIEMNSGYHAERLAKLIELKAPSIIIASKRKTVERWRAGEVPIGDKAGLLDAEATTVEKRIGRGGKEYFVFNDAVAYFPKGRFGHFVKAYTHDT